MAKFKKLYLLNELFSSWKYTAPKDKEKQLYDFYMLTGLPEPTDINLSTALEDARDTITTILKPELLKALVFAVSAEFRHILDNNTADKLKRFFKQNNASKFLKYYVLYYKTSQSGFDFNDRTREEITDRFKNNSRGYQESYKAILKGMKKQGMKMEDFVQLAKRVFEDLEWSQSYGGKSWANICSGWLRLNSAKSKGELIVAIDHVYDLQHNTDTVFNKLQSYYKSGYGWIKSALDKKRDIKNLYEIYSDISLNLKKFVPAVLKNATGQTLEDWLKAKGKPTSKKQNITDTTHKETILGNKVSIENALYSIGFNGRKIHWKNGIWKNGTWKDGTWEDGIWEIGTWNDGIWKNGTWNDGIWKYGFWENGTWKNGTWKAGTWKDGTWKNGTWQSGIWKDGTWENGFWKNGVWKNGTWNDGIWKYGFWKNGTWKDGTWSGGTWKNGTWNDGIWEYGFWENGTWESGTWSGVTWSGGTWKNGIWKKGTWEAGTWQSGTWKDGTWKNGTWKNGTWESGTWENGTWKGGLIWDPRLNKYVRSDVSPKEYFANN